jgi:GMP reductase
MRIINEVKLDFKDVLILPKRSTLESRSQVSLERTYHFKNSNRHWTGIPIMISNMDTTGTFAMAQVMSKLKILTCIHKFYSINEWINFLKTLEPDQFNHIIVSCGIADGDFEKLDEILTLDERLHWICLDVANGYTEKFIGKVKQLRFKYPKHIIIAGNVVTSDMVEELILSGADSIKSGIGSGSACTTRIKTGVGCPQLSTVIECSDAAHGLKGHIISDGGCTNSGDISKAFAGGADFVMLGGMMAGHDESGGNVIEKDGKTFVEFYGMSSNTAMEKHYGEKASYRAAEGKRILIPYRGPVIETINDILGGIRSTCTYVGASGLKELSKRTTFIRVSQQSNEVYGKN